MLKTKPCLLVVDDHFAPATFTRQKLIQKGYEVLTAQNRQDALELSRAEYPDLILSDVDMAVMNGFELYKRIKKDSRLNKIPYLPIRGGIHTEKAVVGVIGKKRFAYDIWVETLNLAARLKQHFEKNSINISKTKYKHVKNFFECKSRCEVNIQYTGKIPMYYVQRIKPELFEDKEGLFLNRLFIREYNSMARKHDPGKCSQTSIFILLPYFLSQTGVN
ncbi:MAG: response regulator [Gracilimonas sp.]|uniref:response regulator n=1 Tax=Gracilimonas sp. TaxID=1974203 RepID=UPI0037502383|nr:response regulator [Gracilimonas sp.]